MNAIEKADATLRVLKFQQKLYVADLEEHRRVILKEYDSIINKHMEHHIKTRELSNQVIIESFNDGLTDAYSLAVCQDVTFFNYVQDWEEELDYRLEVQARLKCDTPSREDQFGRPLEAQGPEDREQFNMWAKNRELERETFRGVAFIYDAMINDEYLEDLNNKLAENKEQS
jgi:hypothetical protein